MEFSEMRSGHFSDHYFLDLICLATTSSPSYSEAAELLVIIPSSSCSTLQVIAHLAIDFNIHFIDNTIVFACINPRLSLSLYEFKLFYTQFQMSKGYLFLSGHASSNFNFEN